MKMAKRIDIKQRPPKEQMRASSGINRRIRPITGKNAQTRLRSGNRNIYKSYENLKPDSRFKKFMENTELHKMLHVSDSNLNSGFVQSSIQKDDFKGRVGSATSFQGMRIRNGHIIAVAKSPYAAELETR
jgi:hypothetical protein